MRRVQTANVTVAAQRRWKSRQEDESVELKEKRVSSNLETRLCKLVGLTGFEPATP